MLSPGKWHALVPRWPRKNVAEWRVAILKACLTDRLLQRGLFEMCRQDLIFFVAIFVWQFNPRKKGIGQVGPFIPWDFQDDAFRVMLDSIEEDEDLCIEKSREMGASWMLVIVFFWLWLFHGWNKFLFISRNAEAVESDDPDSLLWKWDFIFENLPDWMKPRLKKKKMYRGNITNRSVATGQASTGKAGVGGRATAMGIDEFSQIEEDFEVLHRTSDTTGCRIFNFTHTGLATAAYEITQRVDMRKLVMHWTSHPDKRKGLYRYDPEAGKVTALDKSFVYPADYRFVMDGSPTGGPFPGVRSPWYDEQCRRKGSARAIAMDLDIDPKGSVSQFFDRLMILTLQTTFAAEPYWEGDIHFDRDSGRPLSLVPTKGGALKLWCTLTDQGGDGSSFHGPRPRRDNYGIGCDISTGSGATPSCASVTCGSTGEKVMEYRNPHILPEKFAVLVAALGWLFSTDHGEPALVAWEVPGPGYTFGKRFMELGYRNVYFKTDEFKEFADASEAPGWYASPNNKRALLEDYRAALHSRQFLNRSREALGDCLAFRYDKRGYIEHSAETSTNDPSGARVNHADVVIADALSWKCAKTFGLSKPKKPDETIPVLSLQWRRQYHDRLAREEASA